jgi:glyoxylase I family protein
MPKVSGIGGLFFRSRDPEAFAKWYLDHFGVGNGANWEPWVQEAGQTVFQPFKADTHYFRADRTHMLNFRVDDCKGFVSALASAGIEAKLNPDETYGVFAQLEDPEGNPIELWQPPS